MLANIHSEIHVPVAPVLSVKIKAASPVKRKVAPAVLKSAGPAFSQSYTLTYQSKSPDVLFIGGSELVYWRHRILQAFPGAILDARTGRSIVTFANVYQKLSSYKAINRIHTLVVSWGSRGAFNDGALSSLLSEAAGKTVYLVPSANDEKTVSDFFKTFHKIYPKVYLVNFSQLATRNPEYFKVYGKGLRAFSPTGIDSWLSFLKVNMAQDYFGMNMVYVLKTLPKSTKSPGVQAGDDSVAAQAAPVPASPLCCRYLVIPESANFQVPVIGR